MFGLEIFLALSGVSEETNELSEYMLALKSCSNMMIFIHANHWDKFIGEWI